MIDQNPCPARSPLDSRRSETVTTCAREALTAVKNMRPTGYAGKLGYASAGAGADFIVANMVAEAASGSKTPKEAMERAQKRAECREQFYVAAAHRLFLEGNTPEKSDAGEQQITESCASFVVTFQYEGCIYV